MSYDNTFMTAVDRMCANDMNKLCRIRITDTFAEKILIWKSRQKVCG